MVINYCDHLERYHVTEGIHCIRRKGITIHGIMCEKKYSFYAEKSYHDIDIVSYREDTRAWLSEDAPL